MSAEKKDKNTTTKKNASIFVRWRSGSINLETVRDQIAK